MSSLNAVNDLPITPVSATFSDHSGSGPGSGSSGSGLSTLSHSHSSHHPSSSVLHPHSNSHSHSHSLSGSGIGTSIPSGAAGLATMGGDDAFFPTFDDMSSFGPIASDYATFGVGGGAQWGAYSPASSFE